MPIDINSSAARTRLREDWKTVTLKAYYEGAQSVADRLCQMETSSTAINVYDLLIALPKMERFKDQVKTQGTARARRRIANDEFVAAVEAKQADIERGEIAQYKNKFEMLGIAARRRPDRFLAQLMIEAFTGGRLHGNDVLQQRQAASARRHRLPHLRQPDDRESPRRVRGRRPSN